MRANREAHREAAGDPEARKAEAAPQADEAKRAGAAPGQAVARQRRDEARGAGKAGEALAARRRNARRARWAQIEKRLGAKRGPDERGISMAMRAELRVHARRTAKLARIQEIAAQKEDASTLDRVARLQQKEDARHARRMEQLIGRSESPAADHPAAAPRQPAEKAEEGEEKAGTERPATGGDE